MDTPLFFTILTHSIFIPMPRNLLAQNTSPHTPDHSIAWPKMAVVEGFEDHPMQPALTEAGGFIWPGDEGTKRKACKGMFSIEKYLTPTTIGTPLVADSGTPLVADSDEDSSSTAVSLSGAAMLVSAIMMMV